MRRLPPNRILRSVLAVVLLAAGAAAWAQHPGQPSLDAAVRAYRAGNLEDARAFADRARALGLDLPDLQAIMALTEPLPRDLLRMSAEVDEAGLQAITSAELLRATSAALERLLDWDGLLELESERPGPVSADPLVGARVLRAYAARGQTAYLDAEARLEPRQVDDPYIRAVMVSQRDRPRFVDLQWIRSLPDDRAGLDVLIHAYVAVEDRSRVVDELARRYYRIGGQAPDPAARAAMLHPRGELPPDLRDHFVHSGGLRRLDLLGPLLDIHAVDEPELALAAAATLAWTADRNDDGYTDVRARISDGELTWESDSDQDGVSEQVVVLVDGLPRNYAVDLAGVELLFTYRDYPEVAAVRARTSDGTESAFHFADEVLCLPVADPLQVARLFGGVALPALELLPPPVFGFADLRALADQVVVTSFPDSAPGGGVPTDEIRFSLEQGDVQRVEWSTGVLDYHFNPGTGLLVARISGRPERVEWQARDPGILAAGFQVRLLDGEGRVLVSGESADGTLRGEAIPPLFTAWTVQRQLSFPRVPRLEEFSWSD